MNNGSDSSSQARKGKSYGYQRPQESASSAGNIDAQKQKVVAAFDGFLDALAVRGSDSGPGLTPGTGATGSSGSPGSLGSVGSMGSTSSSSGPSFTGSTDSTGATNSAGEKASEAAQLEALERERAVQREAYRLDRLRETARHARLEVAKAPTAIGVSIMAAYDKHMPDSNRSPLTENRKFDPSFGERGRSLAPTIEKVTAPRSERPETVPRPAVVHGRPVDAYYGSFGTAIERAAARARLEMKALEVILGTDDRVRVTNSELYPWRCICSLVITANTGAQYVGTGWLVAPRLLLTAGHCVYMSDENGWVSQIEVIPGRNANERPFGSGVATDFRSVMGWTRDGNSDCDYGAIVLPADKAFGNQLGWFGYATRPDDYLRSITLNLSGYPGDGGKDHIDGTQWFHSRTVRDVLEKQITYEIDTYGGQSGSPVWEMSSEGGRYGVAIHTFGTSVNNGGTRITGEVFNNIVLWAGQAQ